MFEDFEIVSTYTRAQAIADGVLVDLDALMRQFDPPMQSPFKHPIAMSAAAFEKLVAWSEEDNDRLGEVQDVAGRLWDVLWMALVAARRAAGGSHVSFQVSVIDRECGRREEVELVMTCGPGDTPAPVLTIMLPNED